MGLFTLSGTKLQKNAKKSVKKFGGLKKVRIFAARLRENGYNKFIEKTGFLYCTRSKYREILIYREALILLFRNYKCQDKLEI